MTTASAKPPQASHPKQPLHRRISWLFPLTLLLLLAPLIAGVLASAVPNFPAAPVSTSVVLGLLAAALGWVVWRGALLGPFLLLVAASVFGARSSDRTYLLELGLNTPVREISVYCNDVFLGKTPLSISEAEFREKVAPWTNPPVQPRIDWPDHDQPGGFRYSWAKFTYVPQDIFAMHQSRPPDHRRYNRQTKEEQLNDFAQSRYWWRFEKNGSIGLAPTANFGGGGGGGRVYRIQASPQITFPSADRHLELLAASLRGSGFTPSEAWLAHFDEWVRLLFVDFRELAQTDYRYRPALDRIVRMKYQIPRQISPSDAHRVIDSILQRVEDDKSFGVPSVESEAIRQVSQAHPEVLTQAFLRELLHFSRSGGRASSDSWTVHYAHAGRHARMFPLRYAAAEVRPDGLFDVLIYHSAKHELFEVIGNYPGPKAARLIEYHLREAERTAGHHHNIRIRSWIETLSRITHPELESAAREFVRKHGNGRWMSHYVGNFVASRIESEHFANDELAAWIYHFAPLEERDRAQFLAQLRTPAAGHYLEILTQRNSSLREHALSVLVRNPNPHLDQFLIATDEWQRSPRGPGYHNTAVSIALLKTDTPAIRRFLQSLWNEDRASLFRHFRIVRFEGTHPYLNWLVAEAAQLDDPNQQRATVSMLATINTDPAWALIEDWAEAPDPLLAQAAQEQLGQAKEQRQNEARDLQLAERLISGELHPDELLPPAEPHAWTEAGYVPQRNSQPAPQEEEINEAH